MKSIRLLSLWGWCLSALVVSGACSDDEAGWPVVDGADPQLTLTEEHLQTEAGRQIAIAGTVTDADGIASIRLYCPDLYLDKTIDLLTLYDEVLTTYDLDYKLQIANNEVGDRFVILITVTDVGGRTASGQMVVTLDGDYADPVFTLAPDNSVTVLIKAETRFTLRFTVTDNRALDQITIAIPSISYSQVIDAAGAKEYEFSDRILLPNTEGTYQVSITATDRSGKSVSVNSTVTVSELPDFTKMYLADVASAAQLNSDIMGVPMLIQRTGAYEYRAEYYCAEAGTEVFFIPQKTDFSPICFGIDPENESQLTDDPDTARPFVLEQAGVYYRFTFNTRQGTYNVTTFPISEAIDPVPHAYDTNSLDTWEDGGSWLQRFYFGLMFGNPREINEFVQDATNPHVYRLAESIPLTQGETLNFVIHNWHHDGWWNYCTWRTDSSDDPELWYYYGKFTNPAWQGTRGSDNWAKPTVPATGNYTFYFDAYLGWGKFIPAN